MLTQRIGAIEFEKIYTEGRARYYDGIMVDLDDGRKYIGEKGGKS